MFWVDSYYDHISQNRYTWLLIRMVIGVPNSDQIPWRLLLCACHREYVHLEKKTPKLSPRGALHSSRQTMIDVSEDLLFNMLPYISQPTTSLHIKSNLSKKEDKCDKFISLSKKYKATRTRKKRAGKLLCTINTRVSGIQCSSMKENKQIYSCGRITDYLVNLVTHDKFLVTHVNCPRCICLWWWVHTVGP